VLVNKVLEILKKRRNNGSPYLFPSESKTGHVVDIKKGWSRVLEAADIENLRIHDMRRTFGSHMASMGISVKIVQKAMHHKSLKSTDVYALINKDAERESIEKSTTALLRDAGIG